MNRTYPIRLVVMSKVVELQTDGPIYETTTNNTFWLDDLRHCYERSTPTCKEYTPRMYGRWCEVHSDAYGGYVRYAYRDGWICEELENLPYRLRGYKGVLLERNAIVTLSSRYGLLYMFGSLSTSSFPSSISRQYVKWIMHISEKAFLFRHCLSTRHNGVFHMLNACQGNASSAEVLNKVIACICSGVARRKIVAR